MIVAYVRGTNTSNGFGASNYLGCYANGDASSCSVTYLRGDGSSATSTRLTSPGHFASGVIPNANATSGIFGSVVMHIPNYTNASTFKTILGRSACDLNGSGQTWLNVTLYSKTPAITSLTIYDPAVAGNAFVSGSTIALYGVKASAA